MKIDPYCQQLRCSPETLVSGNIRFMRTFGRCSLERGRQFQTTVGLSKTAIFNTFARYFLGSFEVKANIIVAGGRYVTTSFMD